MKLLRANVLLALLWTALTGTVTTASLLAGFALGYVVLWVGTGDRRSRYFRRVPMVVGFAAFFLKELVLSALQVAYDIVTPAYRMHPAVVAVPLEVETDAEVTLLAQLISLTPGSLSLDLSDDRKTLYVHALYVRDAELTRRRIKEGFEARVLRLLR